MNKTLSDFVAVCEQAVEYNKQISESMGMSGDIEGSEIFEQDAETLNKILKDIKENYNLNTYINDMQLINWLNELEEKPIIEEALRLVESRKNEQIKRLQEEINYTSKILQCLEK